MDRAQQIGDLQRELAAAQTQIARLNESAAAAAKEHERLIGEVREALRAAEDKHAAAQTEWANERESMAREAAATLASLTAARTQIETLSTEATAAQQRIGTLTLELVDARETLRFVPHTRPDDGMMGVKIIQRQNSGLFVSSATFKYLKKYSIVVNPYRLFYVPMLSLSYEKLGFRRQSHRASAVRRHGAMRPSAGFERVVAAHARSHARECGGLHVGAADA